MIGKVSLTDGGVRRAKRKPRESVDQDGGMRGFDCSWEGGQSKPQEGTCFSWVDCCIPASLELPDLALSARSGDGCTEARPIGARLSSEWQPE